MESEVHWQCYWTVVVVVAFVPVVGILRFVHSCGAGDDAQALLHVPASRRVLGLPVHRILPWKSIRKVVRKGVYVKGYLDQKGSVSLI